MTPEKLIGAIKTEIENIVCLYAQGAAGQSDLGNKLDSLGLNPEQIEQVVSLIKQAIEESTYTLICGLEGSASLGGSQENYTITDKSGNKLSGELDTIFYEQIME